MYVIATMSFPGSDDEYELGADVDYESHGAPWAGYEVGEPEVSAPNCRLKNSRLVDLESLPAGWSGIAEAELITAYVEACERWENGRADYLYDRSKEDL